MEIIEKNIGEIIPYDKNPRRNEKAVDFVAASLQEFGFQQPIVLDADNVIVVGHTRYLAALKLGYEKVPCHVAKGLSPEQIKAYRLADNKTAEFADWDTDLLDGELSDILSLDMTDFGFELDDEFKYDDFQSGALIEKSGGVVAPFSVLDARKKEWQDRKDEWLEQMGNLSETRNGEFGKVGQGENDLYSSINEGTSNFDPVLAETMYKWFCPAGGHVLDAFAGEQTKGFVAGALGYQYSGVEIRPEQVEYNRTKVPFKAVQYITGDSMHLSDILGTEPVYDMALTSPPYFDLEVYSKSDLSALGSYDDFMDALKAIYSQVYSLLKDDAFFVVKVGEIRDKKTGIYRGFVPDTCEMLQEIGFQYYNELILVTAVGTTALRVNNKWEANRKVGKTHQNILVFYKGDTGNIRTLFGAE